MQCVSNRYPFRQIAAALLLCAALAPAARAQTQIASVTASATPNPVGAGRQVVVTVRVESGGVSPGGSVTLLANGQPVASGPVGAGGTATFAAAADYPAGAYSLVAKYSGDASHQAAQSPPLTVEVRNVPSVAVTFLPNTVLAGANTTVVISVSGTAGTPTGEVSLAYQGQPLTSAQLSNGSASIAVSSGNYPPGTYSLTASYAGDDHYVGASSAVQQVVLEPAAVSATAAARFLDQSSFGPTDASIQHVQNIGFAAALAEQFNAATTKLPEPPSPPPSECFTSNWHCTQSDWFGVAVSGNDQLRQRVAMALSEIWVAPVHSDNALPTWLNTIAADAFTNYRTIMNDLALSPAMGQYLDMVNSAKPPSGEIANENFGREMMQLFSTGPNLLNDDGTPQRDSSGNTIPAYTEADVQAFARAYTGWTYANSDGSAPARFNYTPNWLYPMVAVAAEHDTSAKTLLGGTTLPSGQTAQQDFKAALDNIFAQPNVPPFVCKQLIQHLVTGNPSPGYVQRVATVFADNGSGVRGDMKAVLTAILMDEEARAGDVQTGDQASSSPEVNGGHLREPLLFSAAVVRGLGVTPTSASDPYPWVTLANGYSSNLNEAAFDQPSVFNYFPPGYVIPESDFAAGQAPSQPWLAPEFALENTGTIVPRETIVDRLLSGKTTGLSIDLGATSPIGKLGGNIPAMVDYLGEIFMHSQMPSDMREAIINAVTVVPAADGTTRAELAAFLVLTSSQYKILH